MIKVWFSLLFFISLVYSSPDNAAMKDLKDSLKGMGWSGDDPCRWDDVHCDRASQRITRIQIKDISVSGTLPSSLKNLSSLTYFEITNNGLTGEIPSLAGLKSLQTVLLNGNNFTSIAPDFFTGLTSLQEVKLDNNPFGSWEIPLSLKDATSLVVFSATNCNISGTIPDLLWGQTFPSLTTLKLTTNSLVGELPMSFSGSPLQTLWLNGQKNLTGSIAVLQNMTGLTDVWLNSNQFSGPIPDLSRLVSLKTFIVRDNQLTGIVPSSFTGLDSLSLVNLTNNLLQGPTPSFKPNVMVGVPGINSFCLNTPNTPCDPRVNTLLSIVEAFGYPVEFAQSWKGNDPCSKVNWLGITCVGNDITVINFKSRGLTGTISPRLADLTSLQVIDLSQNNLTGTIPQELVKLSNLKTLDVSNNQLYGKVPEFRPNVVNTNGNPDIGKDPPRNAPGSPSGDSSKKASSNAGKIVGVIIGVLVVLLLIGYVTFFVIKKKKQYRKMRYASSEDQDALKIAIGNMYAGSRSEGGRSVTDHVVEAGYSIQVLREATDNFDEKNILGRGGFGIVYKGELRDGTKIAVKRMESSVISGKGLDEFKSEIAVLTRVRHRNLVVLHGYCLEGNERLLVYQYMPQGTLSRFIFHWKEEGLKPLEWSRRLLIALDVARGVEYLHMLAHQSFIHRDLKPSNILLGDDMHAKVADFGLVRLAPEGTQSIETKIAGTFGYLAPEYAVTGRVTTKVDVYSFGVILMELLTGRKALDAKRSEEEVHLATWFRRMFINKDTFVKAIDETIEVNEEILGSINKVAELASHCGSREPQQRPDMSHVVNVLASLVEQWKPTERGGDIYGIDYDTHSTSSSLRQEQNFSISSSGL